MVLECLSIHHIDVPPSGGSLEIGNTEANSYAVAEACKGVPPSGGSLEIGNRSTTSP